MEYLGLTWIIVAVVLTGAYQPADYCDSVEVGNADFVLLNGVYKEVLFTICDNRNVYQQGQMFLYHRSGYWMISKDLYCMEENDVNVWARVLDSVSEPEYIGYYWQERSSNIWYTNLDLDIGCHDGGLSTAATVGISLASIIGVVIVISVVTGLVKSCKAKAATRRTIQASSSTTRSVSNSYVTPQANATSESYQPPAYESPGYINPDFEPDSCDVQAPGHFDPPPSYEEAVNNQKQISTISNMESPPLYNTAYLTDATDTAQALSIDPPSENQSFDPPSSTEDAELSTKSVISETSSTNSASTGDAHLSSEFSSELSSDLKVR